MNTTKRSKLKLHLGYGFGYITDACFYQFLASYQILFLTSVAGMSAADAGTIYSVTMLADAVFSIFIGKISDSLRCRFGRRRPLLLAAGILMPASFVMMFRTLDAPRDTQMLYYIICGFLFWIGYATFFVCYQALGADVATDYDERIVVNSYSRVFNLAAAFIGSSLPMTIIVAMTNGGMVPKKAWMVYALMLAGLVLFSQLTCWNVTRGCERPVYEEDIEKQSIAGFINDCRQLFQLRPYLKLICSKIMSNFAYTVYTGTLVFYLTFNMGISSTFTTVIYALSSILSLIMVPLVANLAMKFGKKQYMFVSQLISGGAILLVAFIGVHTRPMLILYMIVYVFGQSSYWQLLYTNFYDLTDLDEYKFGVRREGNIISLQAFVGTLGTSLVLKFYTGLLSMSGFDGTLAVQSASAVKMLEILFLWAPGLLTIAAGCILATYKVNKEGFTLLREQMYRRTQELDDLPAADIAKIEEMFR